MHARLVLLPSQSLLFGRWQKTMTLCKVVLDWPARCGYSLLPRHEARSIERLELWFRTSSLEHRSCFEARGVVRRGVEVLRSAKVGFHNVYVDSFERPNLVFSLPHVHLFTLYRGLRAALRLS